MINYKFNSLSRNTNCAKEKCSSPNSVPGEENQVAFQKTPLMKWLLCSTHISKDMAALEVTSIGSSDVFAPRMHCTDPSETFTLCTLQLDMSLQMLCK